MHRKKGTLGAIKDFFKLFNGELEYKHWVEYGGIPHHFMIDINLIDKGFSEETSITFAEKLNELKQLRAKLDNLNLYLGLKKKIFVNSAVILSELITLDFRSNLFYLSDQKEFTTVDGLIFKVRGNA